MRERVLQILDEFKKFAMRGNVLDMAVGVIIGGAFGQIVNSLVNDILMPPIGLILGRVDFANLFINLSGTPCASLAEAKAAGAATINYGAFLNTVLNFVIVAWAMFLLVRQVNALLTDMEKKKAPPTPSTKECPYCLSKIPLKATRCPYCTSHL